MSSRPTLPTLVRLDRGWLELYGREAAAQRIAQAGGDGILLEWGDDPKGLFALLGEAAEYRRVVLPARWAPARPQANGGFGDEARILWVARGDRALQSLLSEIDLSQDELDGGSRAEEPLALLGVPGDVVRTPATSDDEQLRKRAVEWIGRLGADRVTLAAVQGEGDPLAGLAREWGLPILQLADADASELPESGPRTANTPLLWTEFQLDREHRLPDENYVPGLRHLLYRGSLLRERSLFDSLPESWKSSAEAELQALHAWHVSPLVRSLSALLQTLAPVPGVEIEAPLPQVGGACAWLLGLTNRRLPREGRLPEPVESASALARAIQAWDRQLTARVQPSAWPRLQGRLAPWLEGGHLAACPEAPRHPGRRFCFSGRALWARLPLNRDRDGIPRVGLNVEDRRALGWFELELHAAHEDRPEMVQESRKKRSSSPSSRASIHEFIAPDAESHEQLELSLGIERQA